jgi:hypothetical protein
MKWITLAAIAAGFSGLLLKRNRRKPCILSRISKPPLYLLFLFYKKANI